MIDTNESKPIMYILAGPNGSGKSTILEQKIPKYIIKLNADVFSYNIAKEKYPDLTEKQIQTLIYDNNVLQLAGVKKLSNLIKQSIIQRNTFSTETTLDVKAYEKHIKNAKLNGFEVELLYVGTKDTDINITRVADRVAKGKHNVSSDKISKRYYGSLKNLSNYIKMADRAIIRDNTEDAARLILSIENGNIIELNNPIPKWINESVIKDLYPDLYKEVLEDDKKEILKSAREELNEHGFIVSAKPNGTYNGIILAKSDYFAVQKAGDLNNINIIHEIDKAPGLKDHDVGDIVTIEYDHTENAKILDKTISDENNNKIDDEYEIED